MKFPVKTTVAVLVLGALGTGGYVAYPSAMAIWKARTAQKYRQAAITRGDIASTVNATGIVQPVVRVQVGSFVSGPVVELNAYHTDKVQAGQVLAKIDPKIYQAGVNRDEANIKGAEANLEGAKAAVKTREAERDRAKVLCEQARRDRDRANALRNENTAYLSDTEMDQYEYNYQALAAQLEIIAASVVQAIASVEQAAASVEQAKASLTSSEANLSYTEITAPESGTVIDCKIEKGQTLAAQFQTPELFVIAPRLDEEVHVFASVDEADIGLIRRAKEEGRPVHFTVDAYPDDLFQGVIHEVRFNPTTTQNVVTYPVVVKAPNPGARLLPGMTANLSFQIDEHKDVLKVPNAALRFYPKLEQVREEDKKLLEGAYEELEENEDTTTQDQSSATERAEANRNRNRRHVWVLDGDFLRAVEITTGLSDFKWTELLSGDLKEGQELVAGEAPAGL